MDIKRPFSRFSVFSNHIEEAEEEPSSATVQHLLGLRGFLVIQSFIWVFLQTFAPTAVKDCANTDGPGVELALRKTLSVLFWNGSLIYSAIIFLSARTICLPFLRQPTSLNLANTIFRRGIRLWIPTAVSLALVTLIFSQTGVSYIDDFKTRTGNISLETPYQLKSGLVYLNAVFNLFWTTHEYATQAGATAFPSGTLWTVNLVFMQSYTVYMAMVIIPHTLPQWRLKAAIVFILTAWWVQSWAWFSISGLLLTDVLKNMAFRERSATGIPIWKIERRIPTWILYAVVLIAGVIMEYLWTAWRPELADKELIAHTGLYNSGGLNTGFDERQPQARIDNYLIIVGFFLLLETSEWLQWIFANPLFVFLGRRSLSYFLVQSIIVSTAGIKMYIHMTASSGASNGGTVVACLVMCTAFLPVAGEIFYRAIERPTELLAHLLFKWVRE
ncbi:hypothetical protein K402DRAFT_351716 [Aulographum hederae CBS 113979]|uniref:Acyltransferase 3 domain-containing protein n=1 Tax=Aulographum hederae CBS 113979 TaxID=1176131 RepID=A0A6G1H675_9PEZI|nr:hypothetical protein K402DRAFT_351716 [Aulographum hederae CBS 113979]